MSLKLEFHSEICAYLFKCTEDVFLPKSSRKQILKEDVPLSKKPKYFQARSKVVELRTASKFADGNLSHFFMI